MQKQQNNYAFIDSQNVNLSIRTQGWKLNWKRFRVYLQEKYSVNKAYLFIGYIETNSVLYTTLQDAGFLLSCEAFDKTKKLKAILIPNRKHFSALLKFDTVKPFLRFMNDLEQLLYYKKKNPHKDETL